MSTDATLAPYGDPIAAPASPAPSSHDDARPVRLLYFSSARSGPSRRVEAFVDQVMQERQNHQAFRRTTIDVDSQPALAQRFGVGVVPTIIVVASGEVVRRIEGRVS